jgi:Flp pilus assembly protein TadD
MPARADALADAQRLFRAGQHQSALERVEQALADKPKDAQARFLKGLILTEMNRQADAVAVFTRLTEDYPELPEPYNNLAVIYAQQRQYDKAKTALEMAIRTHPSYATAHENLGDIYARLASQAYDRALQLDSSNVGAQNKLAMIRELMSGSPRPAAAKGPASSGKTPAAASAPAAAAAAVTPPPAAEKPAGPPPAPAIPPAESRPPLKAESPAKTEPAARSDASKTEPATKPDAGTGEAGEKKPAAEAAADRDVAKAVTGWAAAWGRKDVKAYLAYYADDFRPADGQPRAAWEQERRRRIDKPGRLEIDIENVRISLEGADRAVARFRQHYRSAGFSTSTNKALELVRRGSRWLIRAERIGT